MTALVSQIATLAVGTPAVQGPVRPGETLPAATSGAFGAGGQFDFEATMGFLSEGLSLASASASLFAGNDRADAMLEDSRQRSRALDMQSQEEMLEAQREEIRGKQEANDLMDSLRRTIGSSRLASASQGVDIGFGTPVSVEDATRNLANMQLSVSRSDAQIKALARRRQGSALKEEGINVMASGRASAANARSAGRIDAMGTLADLAERRSRRG